MVWIRYGRRLLYWIFLHSIIASSAPVYQHAAEFVGGEREEGIDFDAVMAGCTDSYVM